MKKHYAISLFSGAGGLDLGIEAAGFITKLCTDIDDHSCQTLEFNKAGHHGFLNEATIEQKNIKEYSTEEMLKDAGLRKNQVDLVYGGPPCQAFSVFGKRQGTNDPRGTLIWDYIRVIHDIQPRCFIFENVAGLLTIENGELFRQILDELSKDAEGNECYNDPSSIHAPQTDDSNNEKALLDELEGLLVQDEVDVTASIEQVKRIAASQYEQLSKGDYETERIRRALENAEPMKELDEEILRSVVSSAQADSNGTITLILKNGQAYIRK